MSDQNAKVIVNRRAGGRATHLDWPSIRKQLASSGLSFDYSFTEKAGHAVELARDAVDAGCRYIIAVGGDGTINEVANGILTSASPQETSLGIVSAGTTCSLARSLGIPLDHPSSCKLLTSRNRQLIDMGVVDYTVKGEKLRRYFVNEADVGLGATIVEASKHITNYLGRKINYLPHVIGGLASLISYKNKRITLRVEDEYEDVWNCAMVVIANGTHFGGGMRIAPDAKPNDGLLDMVIFGDIGKSELLKIWPMTYKGQHVSHEKVRLLKVRSVSIQCDDKILVEADGELLGEGPVSFSVLPSALNIVT